jgi:hypothetical protein
MTLEQLIPNDEIADQAFTHLYQRKIGSVIYAAVISRPDIARTAAILSTFLTNPSNAHMAAANRYIQYLYDTRQLRILYNGELLDGPELAICDGTEPASLGAAVLAPALARTLYLLATSPTAILPLLQLRILVLCNPQPMEYLHIFPVPCRHTIYFDALFADNQNNRKSL